MLGFNQNGGFYLRHSVPRFPNVLRKGYQYPPNEREFGQSLLCVSYGNEKQLICSFFSNSQDIYIHTHTRMYLQLLCTMLSLMS